jgi:redox-sensitive bicupin YhaK (pirin superfamily)
VHQDLQLFASVISQAFSLEFVLAVDRSAYLQVIKGQVDVNGFILNAGDALMVNPANDTQTITVVANLDTEILLFDLAKE